MRIHARSAIIAISILSVVAAGCGASGGSDAAKKSSNDSKSDTELTVPEDAPETDGPDFGDTEEGDEPVQAEADLDQVLVDAVSSQQDFWVEAFPAIYGTEFFELTEGRVLPLGPGDDSGSETCDGQVVTFENAQDNAVAFNCGAEGPMVAWDTGSIVAETAETNGPLGAAAILAHEFGHVVQYESGTELGFPYSELQADCFAGSWVAAVASDPPSGLEGFSDPAAVDATLSAILSLRDPVGTSAEEEDAHGNGFDRVRSFQQGFEDGPTTCADYVNQPPTVTEVPFTSEEDYNTGGNLPMDELLPLATEDLDFYYGVLITGWEPLGSFEASDLEAADPETYGILADLSEEHGDGATLVFLGIGWASSVQTVLGEDEGRDEVGQLLQQACLAGDWMGHMFFDGPDDPTAGNITLSPGDLDEAIMGLIDVYTSGGGGEAGGLFELVSAYRQGVIERSDACF